MVPMLDEAIALAAEAGAHEVVIGMAHRGRLSVLTHTIGQPYEAILREFEGERTIEAVVADPEGGSGDVKYHLGAEGVRKTPSGEITVTLCANPSHLEAVDPVVEGRTRAEQTDRSTRAGVHDPGVALPILIHGDASFAGQGVVAETLNIEGLAGYSTGGTLHLIANNQIGFTTDPAEGRSTRYSSDLAKGFDIPIIHVNADDPEAAISAIRLALAFRRRFGHDVVVDLVGYRRFGHNEQDEPAYTQPLMAAAHRRAPDRPRAVRRAPRRGGRDHRRGRRRARSAGRHAAQGGARAAEGDVRAARAAPAEAAAARPGGRHERQRHGRRRPTGSASSRPSSSPCPTTSPSTRSSRRQLERRTAALDEGGIDWGQAESLASRSLLVEGIPVRLTGQDTERGTFSHRHLVLHDANTGERYAPIQHLDAATASFEVHNSPLSEYAAVGFEYGYSVAAPEALVLWEAQFGDFVNGAQIILDQFVTAGLSKWGETLRLTFLLPHGYEGNGPEHSSARLERFLQSTAQDNIRVANPSTAAQYFHLLRRQALEPVARPLVVMTPKGLLRLREAASTLADLAEGSFQPVIDDAARRQGAHTPARPLLRARSTTTSPATSCAPTPTRSPSPGSSSSTRSRRSRAGALVASYPYLKEVVWAQEEPQNMGAWRSIRHRLEEALPRGRPAPVRRPPWRASPSEGYPTAHLREQDRIAREALTVASPRRSATAFADRPPARRSAARTASHGRATACAAAAKGAARASNAVRAKPSAPAARGSFGTPASSHMDRSIRRRCLPLDQAIPHNSVTIPPEHTCPLTRRFECRSRRRRFSARSSRSISSSSARTRSSRATCPCPATRPRIRSTTIRSSSPRSRRVSRRRWTEPSPQSRWPSDAASVARRGHPRAGRGRRGRRQPLGPLARLRLGRLTAASAAALEH